MPIDGRVRDYGTMWSDWTIGELIGHGSGGKTAVYKLTRTNSGFIEEDVLKVVNIIEEDIGIDDMSEDFRRNYHEREKEYTQKAEEEVRLMHKLQNCSNVVTYQDFKFFTTNTPDTTAVDLLIRMHKYSDINAITKRRSLTQLEILQLGIDICTALEGCRQKGIVHRDIKPENIFYDENKFLLGDFGISKILENGTMAQTSKGTPPYAAPEQFANIQTGGYDYRVDIYSLGLTLYVLINKNKLPFQSQSKTVSEALLERLAGKPIPMIENIPDDMNRILRKACAFNPEERYESASAMKSDLYDLYRLLQQKTSNYESYDRRAENPSEYETETALGSGEEYETETALGSGEEYETETALGSDEEYETEAALGSGEEYETEAALGSGEEYETEVALGSGEEYETEAVLGSKNVRRIGGVLKKTLKYASIQIPASEKKQAIFEQSHIQEKESFSRDSSMTEQEVDGVALYYEVSSKYSDENAIAANAKEVIRLYQNCIENCKDSWIISLAEYQLGEIYAKGLGIRRNPKMAESYFSKSAAKGNPYAKKKFVAGRYINK